VLKQIGVAVAAICITLGGCRQIQPDLTSVQYSALATNQTVDHVEDSESEDASFYREYAPWKMPARRPTADSKQGEQAPSSEVKVASAARSASDAAHSQDPAPYNRADLLLPQSRAKFLRESLTDADRAVGEVVRDICSGC
jgi:hypothetical protein